MSDISFKQSLELLEGKQRPKPKSGNKTTHFTEPNNPQNMWMFCCCLQSFNVTSAVIEKDDKM